MYLARRAAMAEMIAPGPDDSSDPALALLPSVSVSSVAETALTQALQTVASAQAPSPDSPQYLVSKHAGQSWFNQRPAQDQGQDQEDESSLDIMQHPLEMAVPDQASFLLPGLHAFVHAVPHTFIGHIDPLMHLLFHSLAHAFIRLNDRIIRSFLQIICILTASSSSLHHRHAAACYLDLPCASCIL